MLIFPQIIQKKWKKMVEGGQPQSANVYGKTRQYMEGGDDMDKTIIVLLIVLALTELVREIKK